jgi:hypothetical protein
MLAMLSGSSQPVAKLPCPFLTHNRAPGIASYQDERESEIGTPLAPNNMDYSRKFSSGNLCLTYGVSLIT